MSDANVPYGVNCLTNGQGLSELGSLTLNLQTEISRVGKHWPGYAFYFVWLGLCCIPFALSGWIGRNRLLFIAIMASIFPLWFIGSDYGRWVHIAVMMMTLSWLMTAKNMESNVEGRGSLATIGLVIWATCWSFSFWAHPFLVGGFWNVLDLSGVLNNFKQYLP